MRFKIRVTGGNIHFRVDFTIYTDTFERVEFIRNYAKKNKLQCIVEVIDN